jgi:SAM-dependent methyltransferase
VGGLDVDQWLPEQTTVMAEDWDAAVDRFYPEFAEIWSDPVAHVHALQGEWNNLEAVGALDWPSLLPRPNSRVLDLGAGTGWLSAELSRLDAVGQIDALDSSHHYLADMLPEVVRSLGGRLDKIRPVHGLFSPILVPDGHYDAVVAASSLHHATSLLAVLRECHRVTSPDGTVVILNESPLTRGQGVRTVLRLGLAILKTVGRERYVEHSPRLSSGGIVYDPYLGDTAYTQGQWTAAFEAASFRHETVVTAFPPYKNRPPYRSRLTHFVLRKASTHPAGTVTRP